MTDGILSVRLVEEWRIANLKSLLNAIDPDDENHARRILSNAVANVTGKSSKDANDYIGRILGRSTPFGDTWLEYIENAARRLVNEGRLDGTYTKKNILDYPPEKPIVVYILTAVRVSAWGQILSALQNIKGVCEASLIYGDSDTDALIKIKASVDDIHHAILTINSLSHVKRTQTLQSVPNSRWQVKQHNEEANISQLLKLIKQGTEKHLMLSEKDSIDPIANKLDADRDEAIHRVKDNIYPSQKIAELFISECENKINDALKIAASELKIKRTSTLNIFPEMIIDAANYQIRAIVYWRKLGKGEGERHKIYLKAQANKMRKDKGKFSVHRVFIINNIESWQDDLLLCQRIGYEIEAGVKVRLIEEGRWPSHREGEEPQDFGIMDQAAYWQVSNTENIEGMRFIELSLRDSDIRNALYKFNLIWDSARELGTKDQQACLAAITSPL